MPVDKASHACVSVNFSTEIEYWLLACKNDSGLIDDSAVVVEDAALSMLGDWDMISFTLECDFFKYFWIRIWAKTTCNFSYLSKKIATFNKAFSISYPSKNVFQNFVSEQKFFWNFVSEQKQKKKFVSQQKCEIFFAFLQMTQLLLYIWDLGYFDLGTLFFY